MTILVCGGTGFIGSHVVRALLESGPEMSLRILSRRAQTFSRWGAQVQHSQGNVAIPATLRRPLSGVETVIHCVQFPNYPIENAGRGWTYALIDAAGTRNLVEEAVQAGVRRIIYIG